MEQTHVPNGKAEDVVNVSDKNKLTEDFMDMVKDNDLGDEY